MDLYVYDKAFNLLGLIDDYESLIWTRNFYSPGTFELRGNFVGNLSLLKRGNIIVKDDNPEEAAIVNYVNIDGVKNETISVEGVFLGGMLAWRTIWGEQENAGTIEGVMKAFVRNNCVTPTNSNRVIPNLAIAPDNGISDSASELCSDNPEVSGWMHDLAVKYDVGWRVLFDLENAKYLFDVYRGRDLSYAQSENPRAIFSLEFENLNNLTLTDSDVDYRNMAIVGGEGDDVSRRIVFVNDNLSGFDRREVYVDAGSVPTKREDDTQIPDDEYDDILREYGLRELSELKPVFALESDISVLSNLAYRKDFDLGDIVTIENTRWGVSLNTRITSVVEVYEKNLTNINVNFGSNVPTLIDDIKRAVK